MKYLLYAGQFLSIASAFSFLALAPCTVDAGIFEYIEKSIGYKGDKGPVCPSFECLAPQIVEGETTTIYMGAAVEPTIAVNPKKGKKIVAAWQQDRISNGGALEVAIAYSGNGGKTWRRTTIPLKSCQGGIVQRLSEVWLSYSIDGSIVYLTALALNATTDSNTLDQSGIIVVTSYDNGKTWGVPRFVASSQYALDDTTGLFPLDDKCSVTADPNNPLSAYIVWDRFPHSSGNYSTSQISRTMNGGNTWTPHATLYDPFPDLNNTHLSNGIQNDCSTINNIVVVLPKVDFESKKWKKNHRGDSTTGQRLNGDLINFMVRTYATPTATDAQYVADSFPYKYTLFDMAVVKSSDQGANWSTAATVIAPFTQALVYTGGYTYNGTEITGGVGTLMRTGDVTPSISVNPHNGYLYVVWQSNLFRNDQLSQIALSTSRDGGNTWSNPVKVSCTPVDAPNPQAFNPFVAVTHDGYVGVLYYDFRRDKKVDPDNTRTDVWIAIYHEKKDPAGGSTGIGLEFVREERLSNHSFIAQNGPVTTQGTMTSGDYPFLTAKGRHFYAVYTQTLKGPFAPPTIFASQPSTNTFLLLDNNNRQVPFFIRVEE